MSEIWVENRHPNYRREAFQRQFARDQFDGTALEISQSEAAAMTDPAPEAGNQPRLSPALDISGVRGRYRISLTGIGGDNSVDSPANGTYLRRRALGESADAFRERAFITPFPSHMATLVEAFVGGVAAVEKNWDRTFGDPLGDPSDTGSTFFRMWHDVDGTGINWRSAHNRALTNLIVDDTFWSYTEMDSAAYPRNHIIDPNRVVDWHDEDGIPVWILLWDTELMRPSMHQPAELIDVYTEFDTNGWRKWMVDGGDEGQELIPLDSGEWKAPFWSTPEKDRKRLPFTRFKLSDSMGRHVGHQMAQDHNMLYNLLSDARWNFRVINHPRLRLKEGGKEQFTQAMALINEGANGLLGDWDYISPPAENGFKAYEVYDKEVKAFYIMNHQRMNASAIERSATEASLDDAAGRTSALSLITDAIDEIENDRMFLSSQLMAPDKPDTWLEARVERSRSFRPIDINALAQQQSNSIAALAKVFDAETALRIARDGVTDEILELVQNIGSDPVVAEEL